MLRAFRQHVLSPSLYTRSSSHSFTSMANKLWVVSAPNEGDASAFEAMQLNLQRRLRLCETYRLELPTALRVGTLDSLIAVADAASRDDKIVEATTDRVLRQYRELIKNDYAVPVIEGEDVLNYMSFFEWDEAKFNSSDSLGEIRQAIVDQVARIEEDMKIQLTDYTNTRQALSAIERRSQGNLVTRSLATIVEEKDVVESEHLTTLYIVVQVYNKDEFLHSYEGLADLVVPRSARLITTDSDYALFAVTVFKKSREEFKSACRDKRYTVREFVYDPNAQSRTAEEEAKLVDEADEQLATFTKWAEANYAESFLAMVHLKAIRAFAESVLRYGLPVNFDVVLLAPAPKAETRLRSALNEMFSHLGGSWAAEKEEDNTNVPGVVGGKDFYPYVYLEIQLPRTVST